MSVNEKGRPSKADRKQGAWFFFPAEGRSWMQTQKLEHAANFAYLHYRHELEEGKRRRVYDGTNSLSFITLSTLPLLHKIPSISSHP